MHLLISIIEGKYPASKEKIQYTVWDLHDRNNIMNLILLYGNGGFLELRAEGEDDLVIDALRGVATGTGRSSKIELSPEEKQSLWLYQAGDECYRQPVSTGGFTFINPKPQTHKFSNQV